MDWIKQVKEMDGCDCEGLRSECQAGLSPAEWIHVGEIELLTMLYGLGPVACIDRYQEVHLPFAL